MISEMFDDFGTTKLTIGVTGFSRAGKTLFISSLAQALLSAESWKNKKGQGPLAHFGPVERGAFRSAKIRSDIDTDLPEFEFIRVRSSLVDQNASWPEPTEGISQLILDLDYWSTSGLLSKGKIEKIRLKLVDYPGEWLIDLPMLQQTYAEWSFSTLRLTESGKRSEWCKPYLEAIAGIKGDNQFDEGFIIKLSDLWLAYLKIAVDNGYVFNQPGRALRPHDLRSTPVLRLVPLPAHLLDTELGKTMASRFKEYQSKVIKPFYSDYFCHMNRQIVLLDVLQALQRGEAVFNELTAALKDTLQSFNYGRHNMLSWLQRTKATHVLFAATKADHVIRGDRSNLEEMVKRMLMLVDEHGEIRSAVQKFDVMSLASIRATEDRMTVDAPKREILYGQPDNEPAPGQWDPGGLPLDMPPDWSELHFQFLKFKPQMMSDALHKGFPAINLGKAINFLIGEEFR